MSIFFSCFGPLFSGLELFSTADESFACKVYENYREQVMAQFGALLALTELPLSKKTMVCSKFERAVSFLIHQ